jgi:hypothetical protein
MLAIGKPDGSREKGADAFRRSCVTPAVTEERRNQER